METDGYGEVNQLVWDLQHKISRAKVELHTLQTDIKFWEEDLRKAKLRQELYGVVYAYKRNNHADEAVQKIMELTGNV